MNEDVSDEDDVVLQWCNSCGEGYTNFCRARVTNSLCPMQPKKEDYESNN